METIKLNLIPSGVNPVCHCSQYDNGRVIRLELFDGLTPYALASGDVVTLNVRKPDNTIVTGTVSTTQGNNYVDIVTTEQICAVVGENLCDLTITNGETVIGTLNFIMQIERDVLADGIESQSVIEDLDALVQEAIDEKIYNVMPIETAQGDLVTFTDGADNIPVKSLVAQIVAQQSGSGVPSPSNIRPIIGSDKVVITHTGKNLINWNWNTFTENTKLSVVLKAGNYIISGASTIPDGYIYIRGIKSNGTYCTKEELGLPSAWGASSTAGVFYGGNNNQTQTFTIPEDNTTFELGRLNQNGTIACQLELGSTATEYEAYQGESKTINLGQTVYVGSLNVSSGLLTITHGFGNLGTDYTWQQHQNGFWFTTKIEEMARCEVTKLPDILATKYQVKTGQYVYGHGSEYGLIGMDGGLIYITDENSPSGDYVYPLVTPMELNLTPQEIKTLYGLNNIFADTGAVDVTIRADIGLYIDKRLNETRSTPTLSLSKGAPTLSNTQEKNEEPVEEVKDPVEESEEDNEER